MVKHDAYKIIENPRNIFNKPGNLDNKIVNHSSGTN